MKFDNLYNQIVSERKYSYDIDNDPYESLRTRELLAKKDVKMIKHPSKAVVHYLDILNIANIKNNGGKDVEGDYKKAVGIANDFGGKKHNNQDCGGCVIFNNEQDLRQLYIHYNK